MSWFARGNTIEEQTAAEYPAEEGAACCNALRQGLAACGRPRWSTWLVLNMYVCRVMEDQV